MKELDAFQTECAVITFFPMWDERHSIYEWFSQLVLQLFYILTNLFWFETMLNFRKDVYQHKLTFIHTYTDKSNNGTAIAMRDVSLDLLNIFPHPIQPTSN